MPKDRIKRNVAAASLEVVVTGVALFLSYLLVVRAIGLELLGGWSVLSAIANMTRLGEAGLASAPARYVSLYRARGEDAKAVEWARTCIISVGAVMAGILVVAIWPTSLALTATVQPDLARELLRIAPIVFLGTWLLSTGTTIGASLDGAERVDLRVLVQVLGSTSFLISIWLLVPRLGVDGLAWAQVVNGCVCILIATLLGRQTLGLGWPWEWRWSRRAFKDMLNFGANLQITAIAVAVFEPVTKILLAKFGDLSSVGIFEMVSRLVTQVKALVAAANRALVPVFSRIAETQPDEIKNFFSHAFSVSLATSLLSFGVLVVFSPNISAIWIGEIRVDFVWMTAVICLGRFVNTLSVPAYFGNFGQGHPKANTMGHVLTGAFNVLAGLAGGFLVGEKGVVVAYSLSVIVGSLIVQSSFMSRNMISVADLRPPTMTALSLLAVIGFGLAVVTRVYFHNSIWLWQCVFLVAVLPPFLVTLRQLKSI